MSALTKAVIAAGLVIALGSAAQAESLGQWTLQAGQGYAVDMQGHTMIVSLPEMTKHMMAKSKVVPHGTVFFMHDGHLMMMVDPSILR
jgi:hypothetical protein